MHLVQETDTYLEERNVVPGNNLIKFMRKHRDIDWVIHGASNKISVLEDRANGVTVSTWERYFGGAPIPKTQEQFEETVWVMEEVCDALDLHWDRFHPISLPEICRKLLIPNLKGIWVPTTGKSGKMVKKSLFGGKIVQKKKSGGPGKLYELDMPQAYPTQLKGLLPVGCPMPLPKRLMLTTGGPELWKVQVEVPAKAAGVLPLRMPDGSLSYPPGKWTGSYWDHELILAMSFGVDVKPLRGYSFSTSNPFRVPMQRLASIRDDASCPIRKGIVKRMQVACVGILAQRRSPTTIVRGRPEVGDIPISRDDMIWLRKKAGATKGKMPWNREQVASYVWGVVRAELTLAMMKVKKGSLVMAATDGIITDQPPPEIEGWRLKRVWDVQEGWESPYNGALWVDTKRIKSPGMKRNED